MKSYALVSTVLLLASSGLAKLSFTFHDGSGSFDSVDIPYTRENTDKQCISHVQVDGKKATKYEWKTDNNGVLAETYCVYAFYNDELCGGDVDYMKEVPGEAQDFAWNTVEYDGYSASATVIRSGPCPPNKPTIIEAPSDEDLGL